MSGEWKDGQAKVYDFYVGEIDKLLEELANMEAIVVELDQPGLTTETRSYMGGVRAFRTDLVNRARELRRHDDVDVLPMSLTTRRLG